MPDRHLKLDMDDITLAQANMTLPSDEMPLELLDFVQDWGQTSPLLVHCFAGRAGRRLALISRSAP